MSGSGADQGRYRVAAPSTAEHRLREQERICPTFIISKKAAVGAAIAALLGVAAVAGSTQAKVYKYNPNFKLNIACAAGFTKTGANDNYVCRRYVTIVCLKGTSASKPALEHISGNRYRVGYGCYVIH